jgi:hypothetical protein
MARSVRSHRGHRHRHGSPKTRHNRHRHVSARSGPVAPCHRRLAQLCRPGLFLHPIPARHRKRRGPVRRTTPTSPQEARRARRTRPPRRRPMNRPAVRRSRLRPRRTETGTSTTRNPRTTLDCCPSSPSPAPRSRADRPGSSPQMRCGCSESPAEFSRRRGCWARLSSWCGSEPPPEAVAALPPVPSAGAVRRCRPPVPSGGAGRRNPGVSLSLEVVTCQRRSEM